MNLPSEHQVEQNILDIRSLQELLDLQISLPHETKVDTIPISFTFLLSDDKHPMIFWSK